jgi:hypothetical protein
MPVTLTFTRDDSSAGDTPSPEYGRRAVLAHSGNDDGDTVGVTDSDKVCDAEIEAETDGDTDVDAARLGETEELGVTVTEKDGGATGARKTDVFDAKKLRGSLIRTSLRVALIT